MSDIYSVVTTSSAYGSQALRAIAAGDSSDVEDHPVSITESGDYVLWARVLAHEASKTFWAGISGEGINQRTVTPTGQWVWIDCGEFALSPGVYDVIVGPGDVGVFVDTLVLTELDLTPAQIDVRLGGPPSGTIPPAGGTQSTFNLLVNPAFNDSNRVLKDGTPFTSTMNAIYDGLLGYYVEGPPLTSVGENEARVQSMLNAGESYHVARDVFRQYQPLTLFYRLTGDVRLLDELCRLFLIGHDQGMRTTWLPDSGAWPGSGMPWAREPHGERFFASYLGDAGDPHYGNDDHLSDTAKSLRTLSEAAWAFRLNAGVTSPKGHSYAAAANKWEDVLDGYERVWSKVNDAAWPAATRVPQNYIGYYVIGSGTNKRPDFNEWPVNFRTGTHSSVGAALLSYYMGKFLNKESVGESGLHFVMDTFYADEVLYVQESGREHALWGKRFETWDPVENYAHDMVYAEYVFLDSMTLYLEGLAPGNVDWDRFWPAVANTLCDYVILGTQGNIEYRGDMAGGQVKTGTSASGRTSSFGAAPHGLSNRSAWHNNALLMPWDASGKLRSWLIPEWESRWNSSFAQPRTLPVPIGVFMDEAGLGQS